MKRVVPILGPTRFTPAAGVVIAKSINAPGGAWISGSIESALFDQAFLIAISRTNQVPLLGKLLRQPGLVQPLPEGRVDFTVHSGDVFPHPLLADAYDLHLAAGKRVSTPMPLLQGEAPKLDAKKDALLFAYDAARAGKYEDALAGFETSRSENELDPAHRYNAACAAMLLRKKKPSNAEPLLQKALAWLREDLRQREEEHRKASASFRTAQQQAQIDELYRGHVRYLAADPDLAGIELASLL